jgi:transposase
MNITTLGIDLAKSRFSVHGVDALGAVVLRKSVGRAQLRELVAKLPPCTIGMEASTGAHEWARQFQELGHTPRMMAAKFVLPFRLGGKNDGNDAEAICTAVARPNMRYVPIKTLEQQAVLCLHRVRAGFGKECTRTSNQIRGLLAEFGVVLARRAIEVRREVPALLDRLPDHAARCIRDLLDHLKCLDAKIDAYNREIRQHARQDARAQIIQRRLGVGPISASAIVATVGDGAEFKNGRQFAAWLGMVPRQYSTGGKVRLGRITRQGDHYLRTLLVLGARSVMQRASREQDPLSRWALALKARRGYHRACVAIASKNARVIWAMLQGREPRSA